jgi:hypothetical protein
MTAGTSLSDISYAVNAIIAPSSTLTHTYLLVYVPYVS